MTELDKKYLKWIGYNDYEIETYEGESYKETNQYDAYMAGYAQGETDEKFRTKPIIIKDKWHFPDKGDYPEDVKLSEFETYNPLVLVFMYKYDDNGKAAKVYALDRWEKEPFNRWQNNRKDKIVAWQYLPEPPLKKE